MNAGAKKGLIWGLVATAVVVGGYYLFKSLKPQGQGDEEDYIEDEVVGGEVIPEAKVKKSTNANKWLQKGMEDSTSNEIAKTQYVLNQIRLAARKRRWEKDVMAKYSPKLQVWTKSLAAMPLLKVDGEFGGKTEKASMITMGKKGTNLCSVRRKRKDVASALGYKNPYAKWGTICGKY